MKIRSYFLALAVLILAIASPGYSRPMPQFPFQSRDDVKKLPPVNWIRSRTIDVKHVAIDLRFDWEKESAMGSTTITVTPYTDTDRFPLDAADMSISSVTLAGGKTLRFEYDGKKENDNLMILLDRIYTAGEQITVKIDYSTHYVNTADADTAIGSFGRGLRFIKPSADEPNKPRQIWSQGESEFNRYWFPSYDSPNDFRTTELTATVEKPFTVVSNGRLESTKDNGNNTRTFHWVMDQPYSNYLTSIVVGEFVPVEQKFADVPVYNFGYPNETKEVAATTKNLPATIKFFSDITGVKYPYAKYSQTFVEDFGGGMENISATTQIEEMIHDERELLDNDSESLQAHELAHQWFGDYVTCRDWGQIWLNESFATYMQAMWDEKFKGEDEFLYTDIRANQQEVLGAWRQGNRRPIVTEYYANKDAMFDSYAYPGGGSVLHMLRKQIGDKAFFKGLNHYLTQNAHQPVSTEELRIAFEEATGQSLDEFFHQWLYTMGHPVFEVTQNYDDTAKKLTLTVKQTQQIDTKNEYPQTQYFRAKVDIEIDNKIESVWVEPKETNVFTFDSPTRPKLVNFDYQDTILKEMKFEKPLDDLLYQMANDKDVLGRRWAMGELEKLAAKPENKTKVTDALLVSMEKDKFWRIRLDAIAAITKLYSPNNGSPQQEAAIKLDEKVTSVLLRLAKDKQSLIRRDALSLLGKTKDSKYSDLYMSALNDRSYSVIDSAAMGLALAKDPKAFDVLLKLTATPSWHGRIARAGLRGLAELGDKRGFETAYKLASDPAQSGGVKQAALSAVGGTGKGEARAYELIFSKFKRSMETSDFSGIFYALNGLIQLEDPKGQQAFDPAKEKFKNQPNFLGYVDMFEKRFKDAIK